uniref:Flavoprotein pyridine nucleotide cytochrome reductase-like FAD-binding domain-containing protein n=1 Tax=Chromera velia CCMP2878 TaxID=1169474 RepID=A0A0G4FK07_9ALVE|eukprot:Cvel_3445.t1-p1 / transcript=Cvel_3445.t1 / gene=Cvel_3445 / organism=Chromera_velia_CCMP2878 / gene_product=hypothetical protein / transcript_product=hypothetical protein / location=Cvel_scaffold138:114481-116477(-) / protein_length=521 / sequence_SO=supercontig / SO=protein_coding / is_pseudo=false
MSDMSIDPSEPEIRVCHARTCRGRGSEIVLAEIEELGNLVDGLTVSETGCLGYCSQGPNAVVIKSGEGESDEERVHVRINSLEASARVVEDATGKKPALEEAPQEATERLACLRNLRAREHNRSVFRWNAALRGMEQEVRRMPGLIPDFLELLDLAGFSEGVGVANGKSLLPRISFLVSEILFLLCTKDLSFPSCQQEEQVSEIPSLCAKRAMPETISQYSQWSLEGVTPVSKFTAIYHLKSTDPKRGTPHPRGKGRVAVPITWHTTMLAEVGANDEGPLPWIERDYTPVSTAKMWEQGRCDMLVKIYHNGKATSWLRTHGNTLPTKVWLSKPMKTLQVPSLIAGDDGETGAFHSPASVLLLLAGTGVVALPQILQHRDPVNNLGISTARQNQLRVPIDALLSFREDDVLLLDKIAEYCREGEQRGLRHCTLLLTGPNTGGPQFDYVTPGCNGQTVEETVQNIGSAEVLRSRICSEIVAKAVERMPQPCRVVVSGPEGFNSAARDMLRAVVEKQQITVLAA